MATPGSRVAGSAAALCALLAAASSSAQPADREQEARTRFERGISMFERGDHDAARAEFLAAYELSPRPSILFNLAATYEALRRYPDAVDAYERFLVAPATSRRDRSHAERSLARLRPLLAVLRPRATPPGAAVSVDDRDTGGAESVPVGPGEHRVVARWPDGREAVARVVVASAQTREVLLEAADAQQPTPSAVPAAPRARLGLRGLAPGSSVRVDGVLHPADAPLDLAPGLHALRIEAPQRLPWEGTLSLAARPQVLAVSLAAPPQGPSPAWFWATSAGAAALLVGAAVTGALAVDTRADFASRYREDPAAESLARRGRALSITADVLGVAGILAGVGAAVLGTRTTFTAPRSTAALREE